ALDERVGGGLRVRDRGDPDLGVPAIPDAADLPIEQNEVREDGERRAADVVPRHDEIRAAPGEGLHAAVGAEDRDDRFTEPADAIGGWHRLGTSQLLTRPRPELA